MATYICAVSGVRCSNEHMSIHISSVKGMKHPIFFMSQKELMAMARTVPAMTAIEKYLYFLALMDSTDLVIWRTACSISNNASAVIANNIERLLQMVGRINIIQHPSFRVPKLSIYSNNNELQSVSGWLDGMQEAFTEWYSDYKTTGYTRLLIRRKEALEYMIKDSDADPMKFSIVLSEWAETAGSFPTGTFRLPNGAQIRLCDYWKDIIVACTTGREIFKIPKSDIQELIEHCEETMEAGSIYYHALMRHLYAGLKKQTDYLGLGELDVPSAGNSFKILDPENSIEDANKSAMIAAAPKTLPLPSNYPTKFAYLKAKARWDMAQEYADSGKATATEVIEIETAKSIVISTTTLRTHLGEI